MIQSTSKIFDWMKHWMALKIETTAVNGEHFRHLLDELQNQLLLDYQFLLRLLYPASEVSHHLTTLFLFHNHFEVRTVMAGKLVGKLLVELVAKTMAMLVVEQVLKSWIVIQMADLFYNSLSAGNYCNDHHQVE